MATTIGMLMLTRGILTSEWILIVAGSALLAWWAASTYLQRRNPAPGGGVESVQPRNLG